MATAQQSGFAIRFVESYTVVVDPEAGQHLRDDLARRVEPCPCGCMGGPSAFTRSKALLMALLSPGQRTAFMADGHFDVVGSEGGRYRITFGSSGNVYRKAGYPFGYLIPEQRLCAIPTGVPVFDVMLAQKLMIETDEAAFLRVANLLP